MILFLCYIALLCGQIDAAEWQAPTDMLDKGGRLGQGQSDATLDDRFSQFFKESSGIHLGNIIAYNNAEADVEKAERTLQDLRGKLVAAEKNAKMFAGTLHPDEQACVNSDGEAMALILEQDKKTAEIWREKSVKLTEDLKDAQKVLEVAKSGKFLCEKILARAILCNDSDYVLQGALEVASGFVAYGWSGAGCFRTEPLMGAFFQGFLAPMEEGCRSAVCNVGWKSEEGRKEAHLLTMTRNAVTCAIVSLKTIVGLEIAAQRAPQPLRGKIKDVFRSLENGELFVVKDEQDPGLLTAFVCGLESSNLFVRSLLEQGIPFTKLMKENFWMPNAVDATRVVMNIDRTRISDVRISPSGKVIAATQKDLPMVFAKRKQLEERSAEDAGAKGPPVKEPGSAISAINTDAPKNVVSGTKRLERSGRCRVLAKLFLRDYPYAALYVRDGVVGHLPRSTEQERIILEYAQKGLACNSCTGNRVAGIFLAIYDFLRKTNPNAISVEQAQKMNSGLGLQTVFFGGKLDHVLAPYGTAKDDVFKVRLWNAQ